MKKIIIFCQTKREVQRLASQINIPFRSEALHGDITQIVREKIYCDFKYGNLQCIIATDVAARGLDFPEISLIIQMQPPKNSQSYLHRSGRTGRAGCEGVCVTFYSGENEHFLGRILRELKIQMEQIDQKQLQKYQNVTVQKFSDKKQPRFNCVSSQRNFLPSKQAPTLPRNAHSSDQYLYHQSVQIPNKPQAFQTILPENILEPEEGYFENSGDIACLSKIEKGQIIFLGIQNKQNNGLPSYWDQMLGLCQFLQVMFFINQYYIKMSILHFNSSQINET